MKKAYLLLIPAFLLLFYACNRNGNATPANFNQSILVGSWTLQKEHYVRNINGAVQVDTTETASAYATAKAQFNADGSFASSAYTGQNTLNLASTNIIAADTTKGQYAFSGSTFTISPSLAGFIMFAPIGITGTPPVITPVSNTEQITTLTSSNFTLHADVVVSYATASAVKTYEYVTDYYYSR
jgi:hypothetical protein